MDYRLIVGIIDSGGHPVCDTKGSHTTVEYRETERIDSSHLRTEAMGPEEVLGLFNLDLLLLKGDKLATERNHLQRVISITVGRALVSLFPNELGHWVDALPKHHAHPLSHHRPEEAAIRLMPPHYRQVLIR